jgi:hypothetical protein
MQALLRRLTLVVLALALSACGKAPESPYFPLNGGYVWQYRMHEHNRLVDRKLPLRVENVGSRTRNGERYWLRRTSEGNEYWLLAQHGIERVATRTWLQTEPEDEEPRQRVLPETIAEGVEWDAKTRPFILERAEPFRERFTQDESKTINLRMRIAALDDVVTVPAGRFEHCLRVEGQGRLYVLADARIGASEVIVTQTEWYAPGVGLVKLERSEPLSTQAIVGGEVSLELTSFKR